MKPKGIGLMRQLLLTVVLFSSGCAVWQGFADLTNLPSKRQQESEKAREVRAKAMSEAVSIGKRKSEFLEAWGPPRYLEVNRSRSFLYYDSYQERPTIFEFEDELLVSWKQDVDRISELRKSDPSLYSNLPVYCTSIKNGGIVSTSCY